MWGLSEVVDIMKIEQPAGMRWEIVDVDKSKMRIEATDTTVWFGFKDDIVIRITSLDGKNRIDVRSASRVGLSDAGTNVKRIRHYFKELARKR